MIINVKVIPNAKESKITEEENGWLKVRLTAPPREGKANRELIKLLGSYFSVRPSAIKIIRGEKSREKEIFITDS